MRLSLLAVAALCVTALGATVPLAARDTEPKPECEACSITDDMVTEHASFIKLFDNEENVKGLMKSVAKLIKLLGKDVSVDMVKGYIIGAGGSSDDEDAAQGIYDLIQSSGKCIVKAIKKGNACTTLDNEE